MKRFALVACCALAVSCADHHEMRGLVLRVDPRGSSLIVSHEPVPGLMDAMVMPFTVATAAELRDVHPGDRIAFRLNIGPNMTTIDRVRILSAEPRADVTDPGAPRPVKIGGLVPNVDLVDHRGARVSLESLRGKVVVVSFIYTRCPLPDYCPRVMTNLASLRDHFREVLDKDLVLAAITFDPQYDTPERLKEYAARHGADVPGWYLLTGERSETTRAAALLGVEFYPEEGMITHSLQTAVIDRDGRLAARAEGREFTTRQLADLVAVQLAR